MDLRFIDRRTLEVLAEWEPLDHCLLWNGWLDAYGPEVVSKTLQRLRRRKLIERPEGSSRGWYARTAAGRELFPGRKDPA